MESGDFNKLFQNCMPIFLALGDPVRLTIIQTLASASLYGDEGKRNSKSDAPADYPASSIQETPQISFPGMNVKEITEQTSLSRPAISHHLKILKEAGLVGIRQEGTSNYYYLTIRESAQSFHYLGRYLQDILDRFS